MVFLTNIILLIFSTSLSTAKPLKVFSSTCLSWYGVGAPPKNVNARKLVLIELIASAVGITN